MKNSNKLPLILSIISLTAMIGLGIWFLIKHENNAYIDLNRAYEEFQLKKELQDKFDKTKDARQNILLGLEEKLKIQAEQLNRSKDTTNYYQYDQLRHEYLIKKQQFEEDNNAMSSKYTEDIWKQLNQYIDEFGQTHHYKFIFGAASQGNVMYADKKADLTDKVIEYINKKYKGEL